MRFPANKIFYINLKKAIWRNKNLLAHFAELDLKDMDGNPPERIEASDGNMVPHQVVSKRQFSFKSLPLSIGEKGCFASHMKILDKQIENGYDYVLYLEDDVRFNKNILNQLVTNWNTLPEFEMLNLSWAYYKEPKPQTIEPYPLEGFKEFYKGDGMWLTHAYVLSLEGAKFIKENLPYQVYGIDWHYARLQTNMKSYGFKIKYLAWQDSKGTGMRSQILHTS